MQLDLAPGSQTAVVALYSIIHLPQEEQALMLEKMTGWLKEGGYLLATFATKQVDGVVMENWLSEKGWMFWSGLGLDATLRKTKSVGLEVIKASVEEGKSREKFIWVIARKVRASSEEPPS